MSGSRAGAVVERPPRRVRHEARDAVVLMAFSAALSLGGAVVLALSHLAGR